MAKDTGNIKVIQKHTWNKTKFAKSFNIELELLFGISPDLFVFFIITLPVKIVSPRHVEYSPWYGQ